MEIAPYSVGKYAPAPPRILTGMEGLKLARRLYPLHDTGG
jgi:hypothetical protein